MAKRPKKLSFIALLSLSILMLGLIAGISLLQQVQDPRGYAKYTVDPTVYPEPSGDTPSLLCVKAGGTWETFPDSCADGCYSGKFYPLRACLDVLTDSCDCEPGKCWTGKECIRDSEYPKPSITKTPPSITPFPTRPQISVSPNPTIIVPPPPICNPIRADINSDGKVSVSDILSIIAGFRESVDRQPCLDINEDGVINVLDILAVISEFRS